MIRFSAHFLLLLIVPALAAAAENSSRVSTKEPIINFSLPTFTNPEGYRSWLIRGSEARIPAENIVDVKELSLTIFSEDASNKISTMMLSPTARVLPEEKTVSGDSTLRVINLQDGFEASGEGWRYTHKDKTVTLNKKVRVVLQAEFKNFLK